MDGSEPKGDYFPWTDENEAGYQRFASKMDQMFYEKEMERYLKELEAFEAAGGDQTIEMEDEANAAKRIHFDEPLIDD